MKFLLPCKVAVVWLTTLAGGAGARKGHSIPVLGCVVWLGGAERGVPKPVLQQEPCPPRFCGTQGGGSAVSSTPALCRGTAKPRGFVSGPCSI